MSETHGIEGIKAPLIRTGIPRRIVGAVELAAGVGISQNIRPIPSFPQAYPTLETVGPFILNSGFSLTATMFAAILIVKGFQEVTMGTQHKFLPEKKNPLE